MRKCRACGKEIVFLKTAKGSEITINKETVGPDDKYYDKERHVPHISDCPAMAGNFRRRRRDLE